MVSIVLFGLQWRGCISEFGLFTHSVLIIQNEISLGGNPTIKATLGDGNGDGGGDGNCDGEGDGNSHHGKEAKCS